MLEKNYSIITVFAVTILIPQLLFWWLAPTTADSYLVVYIVGSVLTISIPIAGFITYWHSTIRKTLGLFVVSAVLDVLIVLLSVILLGRNASIKTAAFSLIIAALICLMVLVPMISYNLTPHNQGVITSSFDNNGENYYESFGSENVPVIQPHYSRATNESHQASIQTPLPPRTH